MVCLSRPAGLTLTWDLSFVDGQLRRPDPLRVQALGMVGFGALALGGLILDPNIGRWLVAAGFFLHGVWDFVYFRLDRVVARSHAGGDHPDIADTTLACCGGGPA